MSTRRTIGIVTGITGVTISLGHILLAAFSSVPERYHGHEAVGFALAVVGLLLISGGKER